MNVRKLLIILFAVSLLSTIVFSLLSANWIETGGAGIHGGTRYSPTWQTTTLGLVTGMLMCLIMIVDYLGEPQHKIRTENHRKTAQQ